MDCRCGARGRNGLSNRSFHIEHAFVRVPFVVGVQLVGRGHEGSLIVACLAPPLCLGAGITSHLSVAMAALRLHIGRGTFVCSWAARMGSWLCHLPPSHPASDMEWICLAHMCLCAWFGVRVLYPSFRDPPFSGPPVRKLHCTCCACTLLQPGSSPGLRTFPLLPVR